MKRTALVLSLSLMLTNICFLSGGVNSEEINMLDNSQPVELGQLSLLNIIKGRGELEWKDAINSEFTQVWSRALLIAGVESGVSNS